MYNLIIVDDEQYLTKLIPKIINWNSFDIDITATFSDALSALDYIKNNHVDAVISDIKMPETNGIEFLKSAREFKTDIVFIFISAYENFSYVQQALRLGAVDYITKPFKYDDVEKCCILIKSKLDKISQADSNEIINSTDSTAILRAKKYINDNCSDNITLVQVANYVYLSPQHFSKLFKAKTGENFIDYLNRSKIEKAKYLLRNTETKVSKIYKLVGYGSKNHFYKMFKIYCGTTPQEYRNSHFNNIGD